MDDKIIITAAITGSVHIPTMSDYLPITPDEIVEDAVGAWEAGAAIAHIHARDPETGKSCRRCDGGALAIGDGFKMSRTVFTTNPNPCH